MITTYNGDCLEEMKKIADGSVDMILTDLPYGVTTNKVDVVIPFEPMWEQFERIIKENGAIVLFGQGLFYVDLVNSKRKLFRYDLVWQKLFPTGFLNANRMPLRDHEQIAVFYKKLPTYNAQKFAGKEKYPEKSQRPNDQNYGKCDVETERTIGANERMPRSVLGFEEPAAEEQLPEQSHEQIAVFYKKLPTYNPQLENKEKPFHQSIPNVVNSNYGNISDEPSKRTIPDDKQFPRSVLDFEEQAPEPSHEQIAVFYKKLPTYNPQLEDREKPVGKTGTRKNNGNYGKTSMGSVERNYPEDKQLPRTVLSFQRRHPNITEHPTEKPVPLLEWLVRTYTNEGETVLDATMGSGSTGLACQNTGRSFIGIEKDETHYATALRRLNENQARLDSEKPSEGEELK